MKVTGNQIPWYSGPLFRYALVVLLSATLGGPALGAVRFDATGISDANRNKLHSKAKKALRSGEYSSAITIYGDLIGLDPLDIQAHLGVSHAYLKNLNYQRCFNHASEAIKLDAKNSRALALAGFALLRSGFVNRAVDMLGKALTLNQNEALAHGAVAEIDYYEGRAKDARLRAFYAHTLDPDEPDYLFTYARAASRIEMFADAADAYEKFLAIAPKTDTERKERIKGLIRFYRRIAGVRVHEIDGPESANIRFKLGSDRRPYVKVRVNGQEASFVLDTGSGFTVISKDAAKRFNVSELTRGGNSQGIGGTGKFQIVYGLLRSLEIGDVRIRSVPCFIRPFFGNRERPNDEQADGFIGLSILSHFLTEIDYKDHVIKLDRTPDLAAESLTENTTVVPFRTTQNGLISIETELDGNHRIHAILDSGASSTVISVAAVDRLNMRDSIIKGQTVKVIGAAGISDNVELLFLRKCGVADAHQKNLRALVLDFNALNETSGFEQSGIIGGDFLRHFRVTIDFSRAQLSLQPHSAEER